MKLTVEHIVIAVVALALIYTIVQHRNVNLIEPDMDRDRMLNIVASWIAPDRGLTQGTHHNINLAQQYIHNENTLKNTCSNKNRIIYDEDTKHYSGETNFTYNKQSMTIPYRSTATNTSEDCNNIFISSEATVDGLKMTPDLAKATCESICVRPSKSIGSHCTLESETPGNYAAGFGYFKGDGSWVNDRFIKTKSNPDPVHDRASDPYPKKIKAYRCKTAVDDLGKDQLCYDCPTSCTGCFY